MTNQPKPKDPPQAAKQTKAGLSTAFELLAVLFAIGVILQHLLGGHAIQSAGGSRVTLVVVGLVVFVLTILAGFRPAWQRFLSSNRFAVPAVLTLTGLSILGTLILQDQPGATLVQAYGSLARLIQGLFLDDLFHSLGFASVLSAAAGGLALTIARRRKLTLRYTGALGAHLGLLLLLAGAAVGNVWGVKGRLNLHVGQSADSFFVQGADGRKLRHPLGFSVHLDDFRLEHYDPDYQLLVFSIDGEREQKLAGVDPASVDQRTKLAEYRVEILDYWPDHAREQIVEPAPASTPTSAKAPAALGLKVPDGPPEGVWLFDGGGSTPSVQTVAGQPVAFFWDAQRAQAFVDGLGQAGPATPHLILVGDQRLPVEVGKPVPLPGTDHRLTVIRALNDFVMDAATKQPTNRSDQPNNPAVEIQISDAAGHELSRKWLFAKFPDFSHAGQDSPAANLGYRYEPDLAGARIGWVATGQTGEWWQLDGNQVSAKQTLAAGSTLQLGGQAVAVIAAYAAVIRSTRDVNRSDKPNHPVARIRLAGRERRIEARQPVRLGPDRALVLAPKGGETVSDYLSTLSVWEQGRKITSKVVEVNYPLEYKGYVFYQADYRPDDPTFSGFQVARDSGLWLVYLGLIINILGVLVAMFLPQFLKRRKPAAQTEGGAS